MTQTTGSNSYQDQKKLKAIDELISSLLKDGVRDHNGRRKYD